MSTEISRDLIAETSSDGRATRYETSFGAIYRIETKVLPYLDGAAYLFASRDDRASWTLVDSGSGAHESDSGLDAGFRVLREEFEPTFRPERIDRILLTHGHIDHFGGARELQRRSGAEIWVHSFESPLIEDYDACARVEWARNAALLRDYGVEESAIEPILTGFGFRPGRAGIARVDRRLFGGERMGDLRVVHLPGHSPGHVAFIMGNALFSGDVLLAKTLSQIWPERMTPHTGVFNYLCSLLRLKDYARRMESLSGSALFAFPAHESPIVDVGKRVDAALRAMNRRDRRLMSALRESPSATIAELAPKIYWSGRPDREFFALSDVAARVEFLQQFGEIRCVETERLSVSNVAPRYAPLLADAEPTENAIQKVVRMRATRNESDFF